MIRHNGSLLSILSRSHGVMALFKLSSCKKILSFVVPSHKYLAFCGSESGKTLEYLWSDRRGKKAAVRNLTSTLRPSLCTGRIVRHASSHMDGHPQWQPAAPTMSSTVVFMADRPVVFTARWVVSHPC
ncbi:hypothetical protein BaRGS_00025502 [Batillaria attramentaria]|uniref:Uncharacterized protein n=1 Tax=Batillaria attramentaria TaxID=370345 RepID=A0ABD0K7Z5_9CAEN